MVGHALACQRPIAGAFLHCFLGSVCWGLNWLGFCSAYASEVETRIERDAAGRGGPGRQTVAGRVDRGPNVRDGHVVENIAGVHRKRQRPPALPETERTVQAGNHREAKQSRNGGPSGVAELASQRRGERQRIEVRTTRPLDRQARRLDRKSVV